MKQKNSIPANQEEKFAFGLCFKKYFWIFIIGCIFGAYWEQILTLVKCYLRDGSIVWEYKRGVIYGPFSPVYGAGAVLLTYCFGRKNYKWYEYILYGALLGGFFEYLVSFLQETFIGTISWDYSNMWLNINGRTTIPYALFWGFLTMTWMMFIYPKLSQLIESIPISIGNVITTFLIIFISLDILISWSALFRQSLRRKGIPPKTIIGEIYDKYYTDEFLLKYFVNMQEAK